jgi:DinB superfamily
MLNPPYFNAYIEKVRSENFITELSTQSTEFEIFLNTLQPEEWAYRYADNKWSVKDIILHICDVERVLCYRALRFARKDSTALEGFDEDIYAIDAEADKRSSISLIEEFVSVRNATLTLFNSFSSDVLKRKGVANAGNFDVESLGFIIAGHLNHHREVIKLKYLKKAG